MNLDAILEFMDSCFECTTSSECKFFQKMYIKALEVLIEKLDSLSKKLDSNG